MGARLRVTLALMCSLAGVGLTLGLAGAVGWPVWQTDGVDICDVVNNQYYPQLVGDGTEGVIIAWADQRPGFGGIYAQRVDASGNDMWQADGVSLSTGGLWPQLISDGSGGAIVTWDIDDIRAQLVDSDGNTGWGSNGASVCAATGDQRFPQLVSDGSGGAVITWQDRRDYATTLDDIYVQRVNGSGTTLWQADGVSLCAASGPQLYPQMASDGSGGAIVTWADERGVSDVYVQRVDVNGNPMWATDGVTLCNVAAERIDPFIVADSSGGAIVTWADKRSGEYDVYAQRVDADGNTLWLAGGITICAQSNRQWSARIDSDGSGGAIITWADRRTDDYDIYAQRVDADGNILWQADGVSLCTYPETQRAPAIASDGSHGAVICWVDFRSGADSDTYAQRVDASGNSLWQSDGVAVCTVSGNVDSNDIVSDGSGGAFIAWRDDRGDDFDIYAQRIGNLTEEVRLPLVARKYR